MISPSNLFFLFTDWSIPMSSHISGHPVPSLYRFYTIDDQGKQKQDFGYHVAADERDFEIIKENIAEIVEVNVSGVYILQFEKVALHFTPYFHDIFIHGKKFMR